MPDDDDAVVDVAAREVDERHDDWLDERVAADTEARVERIHERLDRPRFS